jgi:PhnB protein
MHLQGRDDMARKAKRSTKSAKRTPARKPAKRKAAARKPAAKKKAAKPAARKPVPPHGYRSATPHIVLRGAAQALDFYKAALGAVERMRMATPDGARLMHAEMQIGDSVIMMSDEFPEMNTGARAPNVLGATTGSIHLYSEQVDELFARAVAAGMTVLMPLADMFWGDRYCKLRDPFGHQWSIAKQVRKMTPAEIAEAAKAAFAAKA